jgi:hypothetical protein
MIAWDDRLFAEFWKRLSGLADIRLFAVRYAVNLVGLVEIVALPILLSPNVYSEVEMFRQLLLIMPVLLLGAPSGYMVQVYVSKQDSRSTLLVVTGLIAAASAILLSALLANLVAGIAVALFLLVTSLERVMVVDRKLILASIYKGLISLCLIGLSVGAISAGWDVQPEIAYPACVIAGLILWMALLVPHLQDLPIPSLRGIYGQFSAFLLLIGKGFLVSVQSYVLIGYFLIDRTVVYFLYPDRGPEYAISFSLAQIVFIAINTVAFSNQQKFGEIYKDLTPQSYSSSLRSLFLLLMIILILSFPVVYIVSKIAVGYGDFILSYTINATLYGAYYALSAFAVVGVYQGFSRFLLIIMLGAVAVNTALSPVLHFMGAGYYGQIVKSGLILLLSGVMVNAIILRRLSRVAE